MRNATTRQAINRAPLATAVDEDPTITPTDLVLRQARRFATRRAHSAPQAMVSELGFMHEERRVGQLAPRHDAKPAPAPARSRSAGANRLLFAIGVAIPTLLGLAVVALC